MKKDNITRDKTFAFALRIIKLGKYLTEEKREFILSKQIIRSGTAVGALVREAEYAQSQADFIHKLHVSLKEANETEYWLNLLKESGYIDEVSFSSIELDIKEILRLLISSIKTAKTNLYEN